MINQLTRNLKVTRSLKTTKDSIQKFRVTAANFSLAKCETTNFIILTRPRSGSTCLLDLLSMHSNVTTDPHMFYNHTRLPKEFEVNSVYSKKYVRGYKFTIQPSSFELSSENHAAAKQGLQALVNQGIKIIYLERENLVRQAVSWLLADQDRIKKQNYRKGQKPPAKMSSMEFQPEVLLERIQKFEAFADFEKTILSDIPHLHLSYEKNLMSEKDHDSTMAKVFEFLGVDLEKVTARYMRLSSDDLSKSISNYQEIETYLKSTKYFNQLSY